MAVVTACAIATAETARAEPVRHPNGVSIVDSRRPVFHHGRHYCWYETAWRGPGWYVCGYRWRNWGGAHHWRGWPGGHPGHAHHPGGQQPGPGKPGGGGSPGHKPPPGGGPRQ